MRNHTGKMETVGEKVTRSVVLLLGRSREGVFDGKRIVGGFLVVLVRYPIYSTLVGPMSMPVNSFPSLPNSCRSVIDTAMFLTWRAHEQDSVQVLPPVYHELHMPCAFGAIYNHPVEGSSLSWRL